MNSDPAVVNCESGPSDCQIKVIKTCAIDDGSSSGNGNSNGNSNSNGDSSSPPVQPSSECHIDGAMAEVTYAYQVENIGIDTISNISVEDDVLGTIPGSPIGSLASGESTTLTTTALVDADVTNIVTVSGTAGASICTAEDTVTVTVTTGNGNSNDNGNGNGNTNDNGSGNSNDNGNGNGNGNTNDNGSGSSNGNGNGNSNGDDDGGSSSSSWSWWSWWSW